MRLLLRLLMVVLAVGAPAVAMRDPSFGDPQALRELEALEAGPAVEVLVDTTERRALADPTPTPEVTPAPTPAPTAVRTSPPRVAAAAAVARPRHHHHHDHAEPAATPRPKPKVTAKPAPATAKPKPRATPPPNDTYDAEQVKQQIREAWPENDDEAVAVVGCETGHTYDPRTYNPAGPYYGLWQFTQGMWEAYGGSGDPRDASPAQQTTIAWKLYSERGWEPWPACAPG